MGERLLRLKQVLGIIPVSKSSWWSGIKVGKYPAGRKLGAKTTVWLESEIQSLVEKLASGREV